MNYYQSAQYPSAWWNQKNEEAIDLLRQVGAEIPDGFYSTDVPQLFLADPFQAEGDPFDFTPFKGRLRFAEGTGLNSGSVSSFPHGPVRLTVSRWGQAPDECGRISVGENTELNGTTIVSAVSVTIGAGVLFGPGVVIMDTDGHVLDRRLPDVPAARKRAPVVIEDHAWIGMDAMIMKGVTIGHHAVVAARAVVTRDVPPHGIAAGNPARVVKVLKDDS